MLTDSTSKKYNASAEVKGVLVKLLTHSWFISQSLDGCSLINLVSESDSEAQLILSESSTSEWPAEEVLLEPEDEGELEPDRRENHEVAERELLLDLEELQNDGHASFDDPLIHESSTPEVLLFKNDFLMVIVSPRAKTH